MQIFNNTQKLPSKHVQHRRAKTPLLPLVLCAISAVFWACSGQKNSTEQAPEKLSFALDWTINTNHTGLYVALKKGYFADEGLDVEIFTPQNSTSKLVASGQVDLGISSQEFMSMAVSNDKLPIVSVAAIFQHNTSGFSFDKKQNITRPRDFQGKTYGGWGDERENAIISYLIEQDGGDPSKVKMVNIGESMLLAKLAAGADFVWTYYAWDNIAAELRGVDLGYLPLRELNPIFDYYAPNIISSKEFIREHPERLRRFLRAAAKGYRDAAQNPEEAAQILLSYAPELDPELVQRSQQWLAPYTLDAQGRWGHQELQRWQALAQWFYDAKLTQSLSPAEGLMSNNFLSKEGSQ